MRLHNRKIAEIAIFSASAVIIYVLETFIPRPFPWMRFGFGNIIVLVTLYLLGFKCGLLVTAMKSILGGLIAGNLFTPAFLFSISGGITSLMAMALLLTIIPEIFSPLGISVAGAVIHNLAQLLVASFLFIGRIEVMHLFPLFIILSVVTGTITGIICLMTLNLIKKSRYSIGV